MADKMSIDKNDPVKDDSGEDSMGSSPDAEQGTNANNAQDNQPAKRKGGRKPVSGASD
jgi:hypothetical protein